MCSIGLVLPVYTDAILAYYDIAHEFGGTPFSIIKKTWSASLKSDIGGFADGGNLEPSVIYWRTSNLEDGWYIQMQVSRRRCGVGRMAPACALPPRPEA